MTTPRAKKSPKNLVIRAHRPGDMGAVIALHGKLYADEFGWDIRFEALVARIAADFIDHFDPAKERCWIVEQGGVVMGSVLIVKKSKTVAKLRLLILHPKLRGLGLGKRLNDECEAFAKAAGYEKIALWTNDVLLAARAIYAASGYRVVAQEPHHSFGVDLIGETWEKRL